MLSDPIHPMIVHLPLALAVLMPVLATAAFMAWWREWLSGRRVWVAVLAIQLCLVATGFAALRSGEADEERVEAVVDEWALESHEEAAEAFVTAATLVLCFFVAPLVLPSEGLRRKAAAAVAAATLVVTAFAVRTGKAGGDLVYRHGAGIVYQADASGPPAGTSELRGVHDSDSDDD
ncbi:MAG: hypothetical protein GY719_16780 [bacterium]|nr:hypothetical protein [bacterium]